MPKRSVIKANFSILWFYLGISIIHAESQIHLDSAYGIFRGIRMKSRSGWEFSAFRGIPYAEPPINSLRFANPVPLGSARRPFLADYDKSRCIQRTVDPLPDEIVGVEECLQLNVYTPLLKERKTRDSLPRYPVMVWIHGGGFQTGSGHSSYYGPTYLLDHDVVLVTLNYRLGPFGFLSTGDEVMPGNYGLKDQLVALKWINERISIFGGDTDSITLFGNGAGAASAYYFMMTPVAEGLFHRVIAQSGTPFNPWAFITPKMARNIASHIGEKVGCPLKESIDFLTCLREKNPEDILNAQTVSPGYDIYPIMACRPVLETHSNDAFLLNEPMNMRHVVDISVLMGFTTHEGALRAAALYTQKDTDVMTYVKNAFAESMSEMLYFHNRCSLHDIYNIGRKIYNYYVGNGAIGDATRMQVTKMLSDGLYNFGIMHGLDYKTRYQAPIFFYEFAYRGSKSHSKLYDDSENDYGVSHMDELQYLFPITEQKFPGAWMSKKDLEMVDIMTKMWYNFAKYGNPTPEKESVSSIVWHPVDYQSPLHLFIGGPKNIRMVPSTDQATYGFWAKLACSVGLAPVVKHHQDEL